MAVTTEPDAPVAARPPAHRRRRRRLTLAAVMGGVGRLMLSAGAVILLFVVYQLWGTGVITAQAQDDLRSEFDALVDQVQSAPTTTAPPTTATTAPPTTATTAPPTSGQPAPTTTTTTAPPVSTGPSLPAWRPSPGSAMARIQIPAIGVDWIVVEGVDLSQLARGPGHYPGTALPGHVGNVAIAGHRTTYGAPFYRVNELGSGDAILVTTPQGSFRYTVTSVFVVGPNDWGVVGPTGDARLTLTSCNPRYSAAERIVVSARLDGAPAAAPEPAPAPTTTTTAPADVTTTTTLPGEPVDASGTTAGTGHYVNQVNLRNAELGGDPRAVRPSILLGAAVVAVWLLVWAAGRVWRRWPAWLLGTPVLLGVLFVFFTQFSRLLPASY